MDVGRLGLSDKMWEIESPDFFFRVTVRQPAELRVGGLSLWGAVPGRAQGVCDTVRNDEKKLVLRSQGLVPG